MAPAFGVWIYGPSTARRRSPSIAGIFSTIASAGPAPSVALRIAFYLGFQQVVLIGVDPRFLAPGRPHQEVIQGGDDTNHFGPNYFGKGTRWNLPDLVTSESAYRLPPP